MMGGAMQKSVTCNLELLEVSSARPHSHPHTLINRQTHTPTHERNRSQTNTPALTFTLALTVAHRQTERARGRLSLRKKSSSELTPVPPSLPQVCRPLLQRCNDLFSAWFERLHGAGSIQNLVRLQSFITRSAYTHSTCSVMCRCMCNQLPPGTTLHALRYRPLPNENALLRHIDGAQVDGSVILALPTDL